MGSMQNTMYVAFVIHALNMLRHSAPLYPGVQRGANVRALSFALLLEHGLLAGCQDLIVVPVAPNKQHHAAPLDISSPSTHPFVLSLEHGVLAGCWSFIVVTVISGAVLVLDGPACQVPIPIRSCSSRKGIKTDN